MRGTRKSRWPGLGWRIAAGFAAALTMATATTVRAGDWTNAGGNPQRNGRTLESGPTAADLLWSTAPSAIIAYQPVIEGDRVFVVRQNSFIPNNVPNDSPIVCKDLHTGATCWTVNLPYNSGDWTTWIAGAKNGKVYAARSGNGATVNAKLYCLDAASGAICWTSVETINAGPYDGVVFADNGDPIIGSFTNIKRIRAADGTTAWTAARTCSVSSSCGCALFNSAVYAADAAVGGHVIKRFNIDTGAFQYQSQVMSGFTLQNTPFVGPDGTVYLSRTQNNAATDFFYAFLDTGAGFMQKWAVPARWTTSSEFTVGPDGTIYMMGAGNVIQRRDPASGAVISTSAPIVLDSPNGNIAPRMASDAQGRVYFSNGQFSNGRFYAFEPDLKQIWSMGVTNINIGAPAIGNDGVAIVNGVGSDLRAYQTLVPCAPDVSGDGQVDVIDLLAVINAWGTCANPGNCPSDIDGNGAVDVVDLLAVIGAWGPCG